MKVLKTERISFEKELLKDALEKMDDQVTYDIQSLIYYPYLFHEFKVEKRGLINRVGQKVGCTIDGMNKIGALVDVTPEFMYTSIKERNIMKSSTDKSEAMKIAEQFLFESIYSRMKILKMPTLKLQRQEEFYRPYWIVKGIKEKRAPFYLTVDAVTGKYHPI